MVKKSLITILFLVITLNTIVPVYGEVDNIRKQDLANNNAELVTGFIHPSLSIESVLKEDLDFSTEEIEKCKSLGKNAFDLARENGITEQQLKDSIIEVKCKKVDKVFNKGTISGKLATMMKNVIKSRTEKWDGSF